MKKIALMKRKFLLVYRARSESFDEKDVEAWEIFSISGNPMFFSKEKKAKVHSYSCYFPLLPIVHIIFPFFLPPLESSALFPSFKQSEWDEGHLLCKWGNLVWLLSSLSTSNVSLSRHCRIVFSRLESQAVDTEWGGGETLNILWQSCFNLITFNYLEFVSFYLWILNLWSY